MNIIIKTIGFDLTPTLKQYVEERTTAVSRLLPPIKKRAISQVEARVELARDTKHHRHGQIFRVKIHLNMGAQVLLVEEAAEDIHAAFDKAKEELERKLRHFKGRETAMYLRGARTAKKLLRLSGFARWFRKGRIRDEGL